MLKTENLPSMCNIWRYLYDSSIVFPLLWDRKLKSKMAMKRKEQITLSVMSVITLYLLYIYIYSKEYFFLF